MGHPDALVERTLTSLGAGRSARLAAGRLFDDWAEFAEFFVQVFSNTPVSIVVSLDVQKGVLRSFYDDSDSHLYTMDLLTFAQESGGALSEDRHRIAAVFRAMTFLSSEKLADADAARDIAPLWEKLRYFSTDQLAVFDSYDIMDSRDLWNVEQMFSQHRLPFDYVRDISFMPGLYPVAVKHLWSLGVPANYAVTVAPSIQQPTKGRSHLLPSTQSIGSLYRRLHLALGDTQSSMTATWYIAALHMELVPAEYAVACAGRTVADIVKLYEAGVPGAYVEAVGEALRTRHVLQGHADGIAAEYLCELAG
jgi:hypothetical protein